ncbi:MAG: hypothetical protein HY940_07250 [Gammaproteobacteria bacterium]|nr:hypothetical protein [Gammaproteobacteria bacterium]
MSSNLYVGIDQDRDGGMTPAGTMIRDAWVFGVIPESETCAGWTSQRLQDLYEKVYTKWLPYGHLVSNLPPELRERHARIHGEAFARAKAMGWQAELGDDD